MNALDPATVTPISSAVTNAKRQTFESLALPLYERGYLPTPIRGKAAFLKDWSRSEVTPETIKTLIERGHGGCNVGVILGRKIPDAPGYAVYALDYDIYDSEIVKAIVDRTREVLGKSPPICVGQPPKKKVFVKIPIVGMRKHTSASFTSPEFADAEGKPIQQKVEILGLGNQAAVYGIHPDTNQPYQWLVDEGLLDHNAWDLPTLQLEDLF